MPPYKWSRSFNDIAAATNPWADQEAAAFVTWAVWRADGLHYLVDLDDEMFLKSQSPLGFQHDIVDIAHVAWAMGTAVSALDLCAAALGRKWCPPAGSNERSLRQFDPAKDKRPVSDPKSALSARAQLPAAGLAWIDGVLNDPNYKTAMKLRNPFTHSRLKRLVGIGIRTGFSTQAGKGHIDARDLIRLAKDLATSHVEAFTEAVCVGSL